MGTLLYSATFAGGIAGSVATTPLVVSLAKRWGVVDLPNSRKVHQTPTPRLGGLAIAAAMVVVAGVALFVSGTFAGADADLKRRVLIVGAAAVSVLVVGVFDDLLNLPSKFKLLALIAAATAVCGAGVRIDAILLNGRDPLPLGNLAWPLTILWIVGVTVSVNFIDGLDGLAAGITAIACGVLAVTTSAFDLPMLAVLSLALLGSLTGFLFFNFNPAGVFMGDCGSMFIGFTLANLCLLQAPYVGTTTGLMLPALALSIPILDTLFTLIRRGVIYRGSLFHAERGHIHHRLLDIGLCQRHAVLVLYAASLLSAGVGLIALLESGWATLTGLALLLPLLVGLFQMAGSTRLRETVAAIRRNRAIGRENKNYLQAFEEVQGRFLTVKDFDGWWHEVCSAAHALDFVAIKLPMTKRDGTLEVMRWSRADTRFLECESMGAIVPVRHRRTGGPLRAEVEVAAPTFLESAGQRVALFSRLMGDHSLASLPDSNHRVRARGPKGEDAGPVPESLASHDDHGTNGNGHHNGDGHTHGNDNGHAGNGNGHHEHAGPNGNGHARPSTLPSVADERGEVVAGLNAVPGSHDVLAFDVVSSHTAAPDGSRSALAAGAGEPRVAIVHDFLYCYAGAERVLEQIIKVFPQADLFSLFDFLPAEQRGFIGNKPVRTTFIHRLPFARRYHRAYLPLMPLAVEQLDVSEYDIVISSSYLAAKGVLTRPDQLHVSYCHTPVRFAWDQQNQYLVERGLVAGIKSLAARLVLHYIRSWDVRSANGVDIFVTNSDYVRRRIEKVYRRRATTIHPPVDTERFTLHEAKEDFYLTASRMVPYKRVDLIVEAFTRMPDRRLIVVGDGPEFDKVKAKAGPNVRFVGHQPFEKLKQYMQLARAFVFAAEEDFGIVPVEAQACGTPVIAFARGGVAESVVQGRTGVFFHEQTPDAIVAAVGEFEGHEVWDASRIRRNAERFSRDRFREQFMGLVKAEWMSFLAARIGSSDDEQSALPDRSVADEMDESASLA